MERKEIPLLKEDDIEVRIQQACKGNKALALLYKTARTDMRILDEVFGIYGWKDEYKEIKGNLYCGISIYNESTKEWITKWDCGIESQQDDGNERKAEASDALKRAGFKLGIGRELYSAPTMYINAETEVIGKTPKGKDKYGLVNQFERYNVSRISYNDKREIASLEIVNSKGDVVYSFNCGRNQTNAPIIRDTEKQKHITQNQEKQVATQNTQSNDISLEQAKKVCFASGRSANIPFGELKDNQLEWVVENGKGKYKEAAEIILKSRKFLKECQDDDTDIPFD